MNLRHAWFAAILISVAWTASTSAAEPAGDCENCTEAQYESVALSEATMMNLPHGFVYVYDLAGNGLIKYQVSREPKVGGWEYFLDPASPTTPEQAAFSLQRSAIESNGGSSAWFGHVNSNKTGFPFPHESAFTVVQTPAYTTGISNWILFNGSSNVALNDAGLTAVSLANAAFTILLKSNIVSMQITVTFDDGSYVILKWQAGESEMELVAARDLNDNPIPVPPNKPTTHFVFPHGGVDAFGNYLNSNYPDSFPNTPVCTNGTLACSSSAAGYHCEWISCGGLP